MKIGIIAEGWADVEIIRAILGRLAGLDRSDMISIRPEEQKDETDLNAKNFSNWYLVLEECKREETLIRFFDAFDEERYLVVQIDTAERGEVGYDVVAPLRTGNMDWKCYCQVLRLNVLEKIKGQIAERYRDRILCAICIEETDAWLIPLFEQVKGDTASKANPKEYLQKLVGGNKKYIAANKKSLDYVAMGKLLKKNLKQCRLGNESLNLFCLEVEEKL